MTALAAKLGSPLMEWQREVVDVAYEIDPATGLLVYSEIDITVPRQSGKTLLAFVAKAFRCTQFGPRQNVVYLAQSRNAAYKKWLNEHVYTLEHTRAFKPGRHFTVRKSNGSEAILWANGSTWGIDAPTTSAGHGETVDMADVDEAFAHTDDRVEVALNPAMITRRNAQFWVYSTAGDAQSFYLYRKVLSGREACTTGADSPVAYFEWSADDDADPALEETWRSCSPALGYTITIEKLRAEWAKAQRRGVDGVNLFRRSYLNQWVDPPVLDDQPGLWQVIGRAPWTACQDVDSAFKGRVSLAIDTTPDRAWTSIAVTGTRADGLDHVEVVDHRPGTDWVLDRVTDLDGRWKPAKVAIDPSGPIGSKADALRKMLGDRLLEVTAREHAQAAGDLVDAVKYRTLRHLGSTELDAAVACAIKRPMGDAFAFARAGISPVSPLVAATLARYAHRSTPAPPTPGIAWI